MNKQELFWKGEFGNSYIARNTEQKLPNYISQWSKILSHCSAKPQSALELGCNIGLNLRALSLLLPQIHLDAVEINAQAKAQAQASLGDKARIFEGSLLNFTAPQHYDLTFTAGVLIHIAPEFLPQAYSTLYNASTKFILINEYYSPTPMEVNYRGHAEKLFKRDFCGDLLSTYPDLRLVHYGFTYHRDPIFTADDSTWFLLEKVTS